MVSLAACRDGVWGMEVKFHCLCYMGASVQLYFSRLLYLIARLWRRG